MRLLIHALAYKTKKGDVMEKSNKKIFLLKKRKILIFVVKFFKRRILLFIVKKIIFIVRKISFFVLVVLVTSYRVSIIIPSMPSSADTFLLKSEIESIRNMNGNLFPSSTKVIVYIMVVSCYRRLRKVAL
jgi:hypothetical protein